MFHIIQFLKISRCNLACFKNSRGTILLKMAFNASKFSSIITVGRKKVLQSPPFSNSWTRSHDDRLTDKRVSTQQPRTGCQQVLHEWIQLSVCDDNWSVFSTKQYYYVWKTCLTDFIFGQVFKRYLSRAWGYRLSKSLHSAAEVTTSAEWKACNIPVPKWC